MKFTNFVFLTPAIIFTASQISSQDSNVVKQKQDSILKADEREFWEKSKKSDASFFVSFKGGYNNVFPGNTYKLDGSWGIDASLGFMIIKRWMFGFNFDYWKTTIENYQLDGSNIPFDRDYKGEGFSFFVKYKVPLHKDAYELDLGVGFGGYRISYSGLKGGFEGRVYLFYSPSVAFHMKVFDFGEKKSKLCFTAEAAYYHLFRVGLIENMDVTPFTMLNLKIGPTLYLSF